MASCHTHATCYGIFSHRIRRIHRTSCREEPPTDFTDLHRYLGCAVLPQNSQNTQNLAAWVCSRDAIPSYICAHPCHLWEFFLCKRFCVFGAFRGSFFTACSVGAVLALASGKAERRQLHSLGRQRGYGRDAIPSYICAFRAFCGSPFSARGSVYSVYSVGVSSPLVRLVQLRQLHPLAESTEVVCTSHHLTISPQQHPFTSNPAFCMSSQYCGYDFVTTCGSLMRSPGNTIAAGANAIAMRWSS